MTKLVHTNTIRTVALAAAFTVAVGGAFAQSAVSTASTLGYSAGQPDARQAGAFARQRPLTVMGMTGGIEPKYSETTGSIATHPDSRHLDRTR